MTQIDFLDELGRELDGAAGRLIRDQRRSRFRGLPATAAALAVFAAIAVAVWASAPADPEREAVTPSRADSLKDMLGVLRRPETEADRGAAAREGREALAPMLGRDALLRLVGTTPEGKGIVLGAAERACLYHPDTEGGGIGCWPRAEVAQGRAYGSVGPNLHGLAPDGVVAVWVDSREDSRRLVVRDNFFRSDEIPLPEVVSIAFEDSAGERTLQHVPGLPPVGPVAVPEESMREAVALARADLLPARKGMPMREELATLRRIEERVPLPPVSANDLDPVTTLRRGASIVSAEAMIEKRAACLWERYWLASVHAGDQAVAGQAAQILEAVPGWPALRETPDVHERVAFAARNGDAGNVARDVARRCG